MSDFKLPSHYVFPPRVRVLLGELYDSANRTNKKRIDELVRNMHASMSVTEQGGTMAVESMVASQTKNPMVVFKWGSKRGELTPIEARGYALQIIESAEAAVQDASLYRAIVESKRDNDTPEEAERMAFAMIQMVRESRRKYEGGDE